MHGPPIDLRSDTVTKPSAAMRRAIAEAEVGDDVYGEDPTINRLEARAAELMGREAAVFVPTGTMGNQIAIRLHTRPGQEIVCESRSHILDWEMASAASFSISSSSFASFSLSRSVLMANTSDGSCRSAVSSWLR